MTETATLKHLRPATYGIQPVHQRHLIAPSPHPKGSGNTAETGANNQRPGRH
jgi:hypothetical protein